MVVPKKQNTTMDMVSNTKEVKVKEEERDNLVNDKVRGKKMEMNQKREEDNNKKDKEKKKAPKPKVAKYKKNKEKNRRDKEKERGEECQREMDERIKEQEHNERVDEEKEKKDKEEEQKKRKGKEREDEKAKKDIEEEKRKTKEKERKEDWPREMEKEQRERVDKEKAKKDNEEEQKKRKEKELHEDRKRKGEQNERNKKEREEWQRETEEKEQMEIVDKEKAKKDKEEKKRKRSEEGQEKEVHNDRERKEEMELEVEEDEQNERNGNEEPTKSVFPNFFKVVMPGHCTEQVEIPSSLNGYLENESPGVVSLRGPSGNTWLVELAANSRGLHLAHGWKEFFNDHRIQLEYFLVFLYEGQSQFSVRVFDKSGCEAHDAFLARPCNDTVTNDDEGGMITNVDGMDPQEEHIGHVAAENDGGDMGTNVGGTDQMEEDACSLAEEDKEDMDTNAGDTNPQEEDTGGEEPECSEEEEDERHMGSNDASDTSEKNDQDDNANSAPDTSQDDGVYHGLNTRKKRFRKIDGILAEDDRHASKKRKVMGKRCVASPHSSASKITASGATMKVPDTTNISKSIVPRPPRFHCTLFNKSNNVPQPGEVLTKVQRRPALISQRRPVTEEEKSDALERAMRFRSPRPFTHKALTYSEVYTTYFMVIPHEFVQKYLPKHSRKMTLWDPQAKPWEVSYVYWEWDSCSSGAAFSAGWGAFAAYNNLEKSDVCVFEILDDDDDEYSIKVHIHRVVLEITPCIDPLCEGN